MLVSLGFRGEKLQQLQKVFETYENNSLQSRIKTLWEKIGSKSYCWYSFFLLIRWNQDRRRNFDDWYLILYWFCWWIIRIVLGILLLYIFVLLYSKSIWIVWKVQAMKFICDQVINLFRKINKCLLRVWQIGSVCQYLHIINLFDGAWLWL